MKHYLLNKVGLTRVCVMRPDYIPLKNLLPVLVGQSSVLAYGGGVNKLLTPHTA